MFSSKPSSRKPSHSKSSSSRKTSDEGSGRRKDMSHTDMRVTFENVMCQVSGYAEGAIDKGSVLKCLKSIYNWMIVAASKRAARVVDYDVTVTIVM